MSRAQAGLGSGGFDPLFGHIFTRVEIVIFIPADAPVAAAAGFAAVFVDRRQVVPVVEYPFTPQVEESHLREDRPFNNGKQTRIRHQPGGVTGIVYGIVGDGHRAVGHRIRQVEVVNVGQSPFQGILVDLGIDLPGYPSQLYLLRYVDGVQFSPELVRVFVAEDVVGDGLEGFLGQSEVVGVGAGNLEGNGQPGLGLQHPVHNVVLVGIPAAVGVHPAA